MSSTDIGNKIKGLGPSSDEAYTRQEMVDKLIELQGAIAREVCGDGFKRADDIVKAVEGEVIDLELQDSEQFHCFKRDMGALSREIALTIAGLKNERVGLRALKLLEHDADTYVLHNVCLKSGEGETEIDALVISPAGIFVIEMKGDKKPVVITGDGFFQAANNPAYRYPLGERMCYKEVILRETLEIGDATPVYPVLFLVNDADLTDCFGKIMTSNRNTIVNGIRSYANGHTCLSSDRINQFVEDIESRRLEEKCFCKLDCDRLVDNLVCLMAQIEAAESARTKLVHRKELMRQVILNSGLAIAASLTAGFAGLAVSIWYPIAANTIRTTR